MPSNFTTIVICAITAISGCRDAWPPLVLGPPTHFKLALKGSYGVGIELELRVPTGYFERADPYSWSWDRGADDPKIYVSNDPEDRWTTLENPCRGKGTRPTLMQSRVELPDGAITTCETVDGKTIIGYDVYRIMRSIETEIECHVSFGRHEYDPVRGDPSPERRSLAMAICNSLRVVGRSEYDLNIDVMQRGLGNPN